VLHRISGYSASTLQEVNTMPQVPSREIPINPLGISETFYPSDSTSSYPRASAHLVRVLLRGLKIFSVLFFIGSLGFYSWYGGGLWLPILSGALVITLNRWWLYLLVLFLTVTYLILVGFYLKVVYDHFLDNPVYWVSLLLLALILVIGYVGYHILQEWRAFLGKW
jgi:hypothetical protein